MKSIGIVRKVDELGRIVLPKELRKVFSIEQGAPLEIFTDGEKIVLQKYQPQLEKMSAVNELEKLKFYTDNTDHKAVLDRAIKLIGGK